MGEHPGHKPPKRRRTVKAALEDVEQALLNTTDPHERERLRERRDGLAERVTVAKPRPQRIPFTRSESGGGQVRRVVITSDDEVTAVKSEWPR